MKKLATVLVSIVWYLTSAPAANADWLVDRSGALVQVEGSVLAETDDATRPEIKTTEQKRIEAAKNTLERQIEERKIVQERTGQTTTIELKRDEAKLRLEQKVRNATGSVIRTEERVVKEGESVFVEQESGERVRINAIKEDRVELLKNRIKTSAELPLRVGEKNEISVTLPNGQVKEIALPDKALENLVAKGIITPTQDSDGESTYELTAGKNGEPVYVAEGQVEKKFLGIPFLKMKFAQKMEVAAASSEDGTVQAGDVVETTSQETNPFRRFFERLAR